MKFQVPCRVWIDSTECLPCFDDGEGQSETVIVNADPICWGEARLVIRDGSLVWVSISGNELRNVTHWMRIDAPHA